MNKLGCVVFPTLVGFCEGGLKTTLTYFFTQTHGHETTIGLTEKLSEIRKALSLFAREPYRTAFTNNGINVMSDNNTRTSNTFSIHVSQIELRMFQPDARHSGTTDTSISCDTPTHC